MRRVIVIGALLLTACRSGGSAPDDGHPAEQTTTEAAREPDVEACVTSLAGTTSVAEYVGSCRRLWLEPGCRQAWTDALKEPPGTRGEYVIAQCAAAYCPGLSDPRPALCERNDLDQADLLDKETDWLELWTLFNAVVLNRDLQLKRDDEVGATIARRLLQQVAISTEPE